MIDFAWATYPEPKNGSAFTMLASIPDFWTHLQAAQVG